MLKKIFDMKNFLSSLRDQKSFNIKLIIIILFLFSITFLKIEENELEFRAEFIVFFILLGLIFLFSMAFWMFNKKNNELFLTLIFIALIVLSGELVTRYLDGIHKKDIFLYFVVFYYLGIEKTRPFYSITCFTILILYMTFQILRARDPFTIITYLLILGLQLLNIFFSKKVEAKKRDTLLIKLNLLENFFNEAFSGLVILLKNENHDNSNLNDENQKFGEDYKISYVNKKAKDEYNILNNENLTSFLDQTIFYKDLIYARKNPSANTNNFSLKNEVEKKLMEFYTHKDETNFSKNCSFNCYHTIKKIRLRIYIGNFHLPSTSDYILVIDDNLFEDEYLELKEMDEKKNNMLISITHDLRSPLNGILAFISMAKKEENLVKRNKFLNMADINGKLLLTLIEDILDSESIIKNKFNLKIEEFSLMEFLEEVKEVFSIQTQEKNIEFSISNNFLGFDVTLISDSRRLKQIIFNCISNAIKFTLSGGQIKLNAFMTHSQNILKFEIIDSGIGIKPEIIEKLGMPFGTFDTNGINQYGVGFGLYLCKKLALLLGPKDQNFHISSIYGQGTKVGFLIYKKLKDIENSTLSLKRIFFQNSLSQEEKFDKFKKSASKISNHDTRVEKWKRSFLIINKSISIYSNNFSEIRAGANQNAPLKKTETLEYLELKNVLPLKKNTLKKMLPSSIEKSSNTNTQEAMNKESFFSNESLKFIPFTLEEFYFDFNPRVIEEEDSSSFKKNMKTKKYDFKVSRSKSNYHQSLGSKSNSPKNSNKSKNITLPIAELDKEPTIFSMYGGVSQIKKNVLIVDDNPFNILVIIGYLEKMKQFNISIAKGGNGEECLNLFKQNNSKLDPNNIDIIFLDCLMPIMDGYTTANEIKKLVKEQNYIDCFIIAITGQVGLEEEIKCKDHGMDDFLSKPVMEIEFQELFMFYMNNSFGE